MRAYSNMGKGEPINNEHPMYVLQSIFIYHVRCGIHVDSMNARI